MTANSILITGATGFVGRELVPTLHQMGHNVVAAVRTASAVLPLGVKGLVVGEISADTDWRKAVTGVDSIVHLAARVHVLKDASHDPLAAFREINVIATLNLARSASEAGVRRFVFISSIGVNGAVSRQQPFTAEDRAAPYSPYAISKFEAELELQALASKTGMEVVVIRPPLVYGPNAPGNFGSLMRWLQRGVPLPLGAIHNRRSFVAITNLVDLIAVCLTHTAAANQIFLVSDGEDISTTQLLRRMGQAMGRPARLIPVHAGLINFVATIIGKKDVAQRLCGSLQVDIEKTQRLLGWSAPLTLGQGLKKAAMVLT